MLRVSATLSTILLNLVVGVGLSAFVYKAFFEPQEAVASVKASRPVEAFVSDFDRHCIVMTVLGEATPHSRSEVIAITRNILYRKTMKRWGNTPCRVVKAKSQYSVWNNKRMSKKIRKDKLYKKYSAWVDIGIQRGPLALDHYWHPETMEKLYGRSEPRWAKKCTNRQRIGAAVFCKLSRG